MTEAAVRRVNIGYDDKGYYAYVLLLSSDPKLPVTPLELNSLKAHLERNGIAVSLSGPSYRPASDGRVYQWYMRVGDRTSMPSRDQIALVLKSFSFSKAASGKPEAPAESATEVIKRVLVAYRAAKVELSTVSIGRDELARECDVLRQRIQRLELSAVELRGEASFYEQELQDELAEVRRQLEQLRSQLATALVDNTNLKETAHYFEEECDRVRSEQTSQLLMEEESHVASVDSDAEFNTLIGCLLPDVKFLMGSISRLRNEMRTELALRKLRSILAGEVRPDDTLRREKRPSWKEYRFSTGHGNKEGRIYTRTSNGQNLVLVSTKVAQKREIDELWAISD